MHIYYATSYIMHISTHPYHNIAITSGQTPGLFKPNAI